MFWLIAASFVVVGYLLNFLSSQLAEIIRINSETLSATKSILAILKANEANARRLEDLYDE